MPLLERFGARDVLRRHYRGVGVPYWLVVALTAVMPLWLTLSRVAVVVRGMERTMAGRCASCGYDLRGVGGRCPECGHVTA